MDEYGLLLIPRFGKHHSLQIIRLSSELPFLETFFM